MVAALQHRRDGADGGHAGRERERRLPAFDRREIALERRARRILRARVLEALVLAELLLDVGRGLIDRRDDGAGRRIGLLAGVEADRGESCVRSELHDRSTLHGLISRSPRAHEARAAPNAARTRDCHRRRGQADRLRARAGGPAAGVRAPARHGGVGRARCAAASTSWRAGWRSRQRRLLWRVRRKLIISYIFIGFIPAILIVAFFLLGGLLLFSNFSSYLVQTRLPVARRSGRRRSPRRRPLEIQRAGGRGVATIARRRQAAVRKELPGVSIAVVPMDRPCESTDAQAPAEPRGVAAADRWPGRGRMSSRRDQLPAWIGCGGFQGLLAYANRDEPIPARPIGAARRERPAGRPRCRPALRAPSRCRTVRRRRTRSSSTCR